MGPMEGVALHPAAIAEPEPGRPGGCASPHLACRGLVQSSDGIGDSGPPTCQRSSPAIPIRHPLQFARGLVLTANQAGLLSAHSLPNCPRKLVAPSHPAPRRNRPSPPEPP